ncbi:MAG TPA: SusC/RagA family TonB-linked outer membrane protein [Gemmatimonadaceae bacterium]|jgi:TonB-linked SusC/RagA family outer membrane protein
MALCVLLATPAIAMAQQATIRGRVTDEGTNQVLAEARVFLVGTTLGVTTGPDGQYTLRNVPAGAAQVRVIRVGYQEQKKPITVTARDTLTLDFAMKQAVVQLQEIVTTATGQQRRSEIGNSISTISNVSQRVEESPVTDIASVIAQKAPGVVVLPGSMTGTAPTIRIRGVSSLSLSNAPIWVVDGVRFNSASFSALGAGGGMISSSNLNGLNPDDIEDIEIVKGPSAATLYGTDASNGVIVVTTKKGRVGNARWTWFGETGLVGDKSHYPDTYAIWGRKPGSATPDAIVRCLTRELVNNACVKDHITSLNIISDPQLTPVHTGNRYQYGAQISGGSDLIRYFVSGDLQSETGPIQLPKYEQARFASNNIGIRDEWMNPEALAGQSARANLNFSPNSKVDFSVNAGFVKLNQRFAETDNNFNSVFYQAMMSPGFVGPGLGNTGKDSRGQDLFGNNSFTYGDIFQRLAREDVQRLTGSTQGTWRPLAWLQNDATLGLDLASRYSYGLCRFAECPDFVQWRLGAVDDRHRLDRNVSAKITSNATYQARPWLNLKTTVGADYTNQENEFSEASGTQLPPGGQSVSQAAVTEATAGLPSADKTLGYYAQEQATLRDRLFVIFALRTDQNSAFGTQAKSITYPKASLSWIASEEPFFPQYSFLNQFRVRMAYGASGVQPRSTDAFVTYTAPTVSIDGTDTPGLRASSLGNSALKPERTTEFEGGFDMRVLNNRANVELTYYSKRTDDALFDVPVPPSAAAPATSVRKNFASVKNTGVELAITTTVVDRRNIGWDLTFAASHNNNKVLKLANDNAGLPILVNGTGANRDSVGFPVRGWYYRQYTFADSNSDGIIVPSEVIVDRTFRYSGNSIPKDIVSLTNGVDLFNRQVRINASFDYKGGYSIANGTYSFQCGNNLACPGLSNPDASIEDQAAAIAFTAKSPTNTSWGYLENGQFWRFRELSVVWNAPASFSRYTRASSASLVLGARNLKVWTKYKGADPEEGYGTGDVQSTFSSSAPRQYYTLRLNLHY